MTLDSWELLPAHSEVTVSRPGCVELTGLAVHRLEVQVGELAKESTQRDTGSLGAGSDCASTRGMAGSIVSAYTLPDRWDIILRSLIWVWFYVFSVWPSVISLDIPLFFLVFSRLCYFPLCSSWIDLISTQHYNYAANRSPPPGHDWLKQIWNKKTETRFDIVCYQILVLLTWSRICETTSKISAVWDKPNTFLP